MTCSGVIACQPDWQNRDMDHQVSAEVSDLQSD